MSQRKRCPALAFLVLFILCTFGLSAKTALAQASTPTAPPIKSFGPVTDYNAALPNSSNVLRFRRGERYDVPDPALPALGEQSDAVGVVEDMSSFYHDPMPFNQSDAVVFGSIASGQAFLTNDKRAIYSEFKLNVQEALKVPTSRYIQAGDSIDVEREGGAIRLPSGKVLIRGSKDYSMPQVGKRYLLFLRYNQSTEDFHVVGGYQLEGQHSYSLDELGYSQSDRQHEILVHPLRDQGESEDQLLSHARAAKPPNKGGK
jgi:hypothetical protein